MKLTKHKCTSKEVQIKDVIVSNKEARPKAFIRVGVRLSLDLDKIQLRGNLPHDIATTLCDMISDAIGEDDDRPRWAGASYKNALGSLDVKLEGVFGSVGFTGVPSGNLKVKPAEEHDDRINLEFRLISIIDRAEMGDLALCLLEGTRITCAPVPDAQQALDFAEEEVKPAKSKPKNGKPKDAVADLVKKGKKAARKRGKKAAAAAPA